MNIKYKSTVVNKKDVNKERKKKKTASNCSGSIYIFRIHYHFDTLDT
jgi:hypothetical protein